MRTQALAVKFADAGHIAGLTFEPTDNVLRDINVELVAPPKASHKLLDFSKVPQARIHVDVVLKPESYLAHEV